MTMNEKLVQLRKDKRLTQIELAEALNVSRQREETAREKKHIKWMICLVCVLIAIIVILGAKLAALQNKPEVLTFDMIEEDWNGLEVTEIPMEWPW